MAQSKVDIKVAVDGAEASVVKLQTVGNAGAEATKKVQAGSKDAAGALGALEKVTELVHEKMTEFAGGGGAVGEVLTRLGPAGFAAAAAMGGMVNVMGIALAEADALERRMLKLNAMLEATGGASGKTAAQIDTFSKQMAQNTLATQDAVQDAATRLLAFRSVSGEVFDQTLRLAQDLSAAGFGGLSENAVKLGKALESPAEGLTALSRVGIVFSDQMKEQIRTLDENGEHLKAQQLIITELTSRVGGVGAAERNTLSGAWHAFGETVSDTFETLGQSSGLLGVLRDAVDGMTSSMQRFTESNFTAQGELDRLLRLQANPGWKTVADDVRKRTEARIAQLEAQFKAEKLAVDAEEGLARRKAELAAQDRAEAEASAKAAADQKKIIEDNVKAFDAMVDRQAKEQAAAEKAREARAKFVDELGRQASEQQRLLAVVALGTDAQDEVRLQIEIETNLRKLGTEATDNQHKAVEAYTRAQFEAKRGVEQYTESQKEQIEAQKQHEADVKRYAELQAKQAKKLFDEILKFSQEASTQVVDAFVAILDGSKSPLDGLKNYALRIFKEIAAAAFITPVIQPIIAGAVTGAASMFAGSAAAGGGAMGGASNLLGAGSSLYSLSGGSAGMFSGIGAGATGAVNSFGASMGFGGVSPSFVGPLMPGTGVAANAGALTSASLSSVLGAGALGAVGGNVLAGLLGLNKTGGTIGGGLGGAAGAAIGSIVPGVGTVIGGIVGTALGSVLGGLFGKSGPSNKSQGYEVDLGTWSSQWTGDQVGGKKFDQANRDQADTFVGNFKQFVTGITAATGGSLNIAGGNSLGVVMGSRDGVDVRLGSTQRNFESAAEAMKYAVATVVTSLEGVPDNVKTAMSQIDWSDDLQKGLNLVAFAKNFDDTIQAMLKGSLDPQKDAFIQAQRVVEAYIGQIRDFKKTTADLGLNTADADRATRSFVERLVGLGETVDEQSPLAKSVEGIKGTFAAIGPLLDEVGIGADRAGELLAKALAEITSGFNQSIADQILQIKDPKAYEIEALDRAFDKIRADAVIAGADLIKVEELYQLKRKQVVDKYVTEVADLADVIVQGGLTIAQQILQIKDPKAFDLAELDAEFATLRKNATASGQSLVEIEELYGLRRAQIVARYAAATADGVVEALKPVGDMLGMIGELYGERIKQLEDEAGALDKTRASWIKIKEELRGFSAGLLIDSNLSPLGLEARRNEALTQLQDAYGRLMGGDPEAAGEVKGLSTAFLQLEKEFSRSSSQYGASFDMVRTMLANAQRYAGQQVTVADLQLSTLRAILATLQGQRDATVAGTTKPAGYNVADQSALVSAYSAARGSMSDADFLGTAGGSLWITARDNLIAGITDPALLASNVKLFADQRNQPGLADVGQSGLDATISQMRKLGLNVPSFDGGGMVRNTGLALVHAGEAVVRTKGGSIPVDNSGLAQQVGALVAIVQGLVQVAGEGHARTIEALGRVVDNTGRVADAGESAIVLGAAAGRSRVLS
jgi:hypothetical protein